MADENSFDIVSKIDLAEVDNAINQTLKEVATRYDLKGIFCTLERQELKITLISEDKFKLRSVDEIFRQKLVRRGVPLKGLTFAEPVPSAGGRVTQSIEIQSGIPTEKAREIVKVIKGTKIKVQAAIQADQVRVTGKNRDDLQAVMRVLKETDLGIDMQFTNYR